MEVFSSVHFFNVHFTVWINAPISQYITQSIKPSRHILARSYHSQESHYQLIVENRSGHTVFYVR
jgi:hypothetical protein